MTDKYPNLLSVRCYKLLYDKAIDNDSLKFEYQGKRIKLTSGQGIYKKVC